MSSQLNLNPTQQRLINKIRTELGVNAISYLENPDVSDILLNCDGTLRVKYLGEKKKQLIGSISASNADAIIKTIASYIGTTITLEKPILECMLPLDGSRFSGSISPLTQQASFAIRKRASKIFTLQQYLDASIITKRQYEILQKLILDRKNILVVGSTRSGKTTFVNALVNCMVKLTPEDRLLILEDTPEIQCPKNADRKFLLTSDHASMMELLQHTLRQDPDRIIIGEVRGKEALDLIDSWNTGHDGGVCTIHANSAIAGLTRIEQLVRRVISSPIEAEIALAVDFVIFIKNTKKEGRKVKEIIEVQSFDKNKNIYITKEII